MAKIAILVEKIYEDLELQYPRLRLKEAGHTVEIIGPKAGETYIGKHGYPQKSEKAASDVKAGDYALIVIPGGSSQKTPRWVGWNGCRRSSARRGLSPQWRPASGWSCASGRSHRTCGRPRNYPGDPGMRGCGVPALCSPLSTAMEERL